MERRVKIVHDTFYQFDAPVFIHPHYLRFKPKVTPYSKPLTFELSVFPIPIGKSEQRDTESNLVHFCWFDYFHHSLSIRSESVVVLREINPFDFILFPEHYSGLPFTYDPSLRDNLHASLLINKVDYPLIDYGNAILSASGNHTLNFITHLTQRIHADFNAESRLVGPPHDSNLTFHLKKGSCRDLSWMQIQLLRFMGIAARFVSGYYFMPVQNTLPELHGWLEVYLPGAGWIGFDPSHGIIAGSSHIPVCASSQYLSLIHI